MGRKWLGRANLSSITHQYMYTCSYEKKMELVTMIQKGTLLEILAETNIVIWPHWLNSGRSSLTNEKDHHYFLNRFVCVGEFFDG